jgi:hypothetical protein
MTCVLACWQAAVVNESLRTLLENELTSISYDELGFIEEGPIKQKDRALQVQSS